MLLSWESRLRFKPSFLTGLTGSAGVLVNQERIRLIKPPVTAFLGLVVLALRSTCKGAGCAGCIVLTKALGLALASLGLVGCQPVVSSDSLTSS